MTFQEFKRDAERFSPMDTPQKLEWCKWAYETSRLREEDNNFLEPLQETDDGLSLLYTYNLYSILGFHQISDKQVTFLSQPAFEPESVLVIEQHSDIYAVSFTRLHSNYWLFFYQDNAINTCEKSTLIYYLEKPVGDQLFALLEQEILKARKPRAAFMTLDGVKHTMSKVIAGQRINVCKHSPPTESRSGKIVRLMEKISLFSTQDAIEEKEICSCCRIWLKRYDAKKVSVQS